MQAPNTYPFGGYSHSIPQFTNWMLSPPPPCKIVILGRSPLNFPILTPQPPPPPGVSLYSHCHQMIAQAWPKGPRCSARVAKRSEFFQPINHHQLGAGVFRGGGGAYRLSEFASWYFQVYISVHTRAPFEEGMNLPPQHNTQHNTTHDHSMMHHTNVKEHCTMSEMQASPKQFTKTIVQKQGERKG